MTFYKRCYTHQYNKLEAGVEGVQYFNETKIKHNIPITQKGMIGKHTEERVSSDSRSYHNVLFAIDK